MDIYGHGQVMGMLLVCYANHCNISIDKLYDEIRKNPSHFISGMGDGIGGNHNNSKEMNNLNLELLKCE